MAQLPLRRAVLSAALLVVLVAAAPAQAAPTITTQQHRFLDGVAGANWGPVFLKAAGGVPPYAWSRASGTPPPGLDVQPSGRIEGRTTAAGTYTFTVRVTDAASTSALRTFTIQVLPSYSPPAALASVPRPFGYVQSAFFLGGCTACDPGDVNRNKALIRAYLRRFDGGEVFFNSLETASDFQRVRTFTQAVQQVRSESGREFLGVYSNGRLPDFFFATDIANQPGHYRAQALKSDGSLWERKPDSEHVLQTVFGTHAEHVDITSDEAVRALTDRVAAAYDHEGPATASVGPLTGFWVLNEAKATTLYLPFALEPHADSPDNEDLVPAASGVLRPACDHGWNERRVNPPLLRGGDPCVLYADGDARNSWLLGPKRALALFSLAARDAFVAYAAARGVAVGTLPADRAEFNDSDAQVQLPPHVGFVPLSNTTVWNVWKDWVFQVWHDYVDKLIRAVTFAQAGNPGFKGVIYFQLPGWATFRAPIKDEIITYQYSDTADVVRTASGRLGAFARYDELDGFVGATDVEKMIRNPWITVWLHETTTPMLGLGGGSPDRNGDRSILSHPTGIYEWNHQAAAVKLLAQRNNKRFGLFARYFYFGGAADPQLSAADWEWNWDRHIPLLNPDVMSTLPPGFYLTQADIEDPYKPLFAGSNGRFGPSWSARMANLRCALNPAGQALGPVPPNGSTSRPVTQALAWTAGLSTTTQRVHFGTSPAGLVLRSSQTATTFSPGTLAHGTTYYWRIDGVGPCAVSTGPVWSFTTAAAPNPPSISIAWVQPSSVSWGPPNTLTAAGHALNGTGMVQMSWRDVSIGGAWTVAPFQPTPSPADGTWSNTIPSAYYCHDFQVKATYSGVTSSVFTYNGRTSGHCNEQARIIWIQPASRAGFGPPGSLVVAGSASGAPSGAGVVMSWRNVTAGTPWTQEGFAPPPDANGIWLNAIPNANPAHRFEVLVRYDVTTSTTCTYAANGGITWCP